MKIIAEIPARAGSKRVKNKNLRPLNGSPMISYAIQAAKRSRLLTDIYVNSDSNEIGNYGESLGVKFYKRPEELGGDHTTSDEYNYDFINAIKPDILVQVNPVCPLIDGDDIDNIIAFFIDKNADSLVTIKEERLQAFYKNKPINFDINKKLPRTQDITPIQICSWPVAIWKSKTFKKAFEEDGHAVFSGNLELYPVSQLKSIKISYEEDFILAETLLKRGF
tara:strand:- start:2190 stop:2855 length:666 start_codon:yes stop_codon:yes gene_type:complete